MRTARRVIAFDDLQRLSFSNSPRCPAAVEARTNPRKRGVRMEWVGIGWHEDGKPHGDEPVVVERCHVKQARAALALALAEGKS